MAIGQLFGSELYTVMSNAGMLVFIITILLLMAEVDKDIVKTDDIASFLVQVALKGDQTRMSTFTQARHEKRQMNEDGPSAVLADNGAKQPDISSNYTDANENESLPEGDISEARGG